MKPIIFCRIADMKYYKGTTNDQPHNGGSYVNQYGEAHECYNFAPCFIDGTDEEFCLGYARIAQNQENRISQLHIEKIAGCKSMKSAEKIDSVIVVFCSKAPGSKYQRVVGFYKNATVFRYPQYLDFEDDEGNIYCQEFNFIAKAGDCVLLPYNVRHTKAQWYVPSSRKTNDNFGFGRSNLWYGEGYEKDPALRDYMERMIKSIEEYDGENWIYKEAPAK